MTRRTLGLILTLIVVVVWAPIASEAQDAGKVARIGYLSPGTAAAEAGLRQAFIEGLREHGWIEDKNLAIEYRWEGAGQPTLHALAAELAQLPLAAIFATNTPAALAMKQTGTTRPVVFATVSEPVAIGLVESLAQPGRNFTGLTTINRDLMPKRLELLKETIPGLARVGYLANPGYEVHTAQLTAMEAAARRLGLTLHLAEVRAPAEFEGAFARLAAAHVGAFIVQQDYLFIDNRARVIAAAARHRLPGMYVFSLYPHSGGFMSYGAKAEELYRRAAEYMDRILISALLILPGLLFSLHDRRLAALAVQHRLPAIYTTQSFAEAGGLLAYGPKPAEVSRLGAGYVDRILKGAKPADLPVERPTAFELVINLKTAQALGLTIPPVLLFQAAEMIR
jgi:putative tryptophan/tyrosine transport system substrate-binding protein